MDRSASRKGKCKAKHSKGKQERNTVQKTEGLAAMRKITEVSK